MKQENIEPNIICHNAMLRVISKADPEKIEPYFVEIPNPDIFSYSLYISTLAKNGQHEEGTEIKVFFFFEF